MIWRRRTFTFIRQYHSLRRVLMQSRVLKLRGWESTESLTAHHLFIKMASPMKSLGPTDPITLTVDQAKELMEHIDNICKKYGVEYLDKHYANLLDSDSKIYEGARHDSLISIANSILFRNGGRNGIKKSRLASLNSNFVTINEERCIPPLPIKEVNSIWKDAVDYYRRTKEQREGAERRRRS